MIFKSKSLPSVGLVCLSEFQDKIKRFKRKELCDPTSVRKELCDPTSVQERNTPYKSMETSQYQN